ncbi:MAG: triacylglycerol lipase [Oscillospiraceae bacterium]|jgi:triacylglycerol lipase|nr:triacylglycerol lipase [Oscillospiraceae bacterium]
MQRLRSLFLTLILSVVGVVGAGMVPAAAETAKTCHTQYPILLVHGAGFRDKILFTSYWGRIPAALEAQGAQLFYGGTDIWGSIEQSAAVLQKTVDGILAKTGASKVNIIAHSKGGIEARYMIASLGMADKVASLTTISTPHRGSKTVDLYLGWPTFLQKAVAVPLNAVSFLRGDKRPDFYRGVLALGTEYMTDFNQKNPDAAGVYYQSWAGEMTVPGSDLILFLTNQVINKREGRNDGMVTVESAKWGNFRGVIRSNATRGVSHIDEIDGRRMNFPAGAGDGYNDIRVFYMDLVRDLKARGY